MTESKSAQELFQAHVDFDSETGFKGLPPEWESLIKGSISKDECIANSAAVLEVINFHQRGMVPRGTSLSDAPDYKKALREKSILDLKAAGKEPPADTTLSCLEISEDEDQYTARSVSTGFTNACGRFYDIPFLSLSSQQPRLVR